MVSSAASRGVVGIVVSAMGPSPEWAETGRARCRRAHKPDSGARPVFLSGFVDVARAVGPGRGPLQAAGRQKSGAWDDIARPMEGINCQIISVVAELELTSRHW